MAKTVSRSGDNGNSTPVNVPFDDGIYVEHKADPVDLLAHGIHGSVQTITEELRRDPFVLRAVQRGRIRFLNDEEAITRINELAEESNEQDDHLSHLMESLGDNASENNGMYKIDLPDEAEPKGPSQTPQQIWGESNRPTNLK